MAIDHTFDTTFEKLRQNIPLNYLMALATRYSGDKNGQLNPVFSTPDGRGGLFGVSATAVDGYNQKFGTSFPATMVSDPQVCTAIAVYLLQTVISYLAANHPATMREDWTNREYVGTITLAYLLGYADKGGIGEAIKHLEADFPGKPVVLDNVAAAAKQYKMASYLYSPGNVAFAKDVVNYYLGQAKPSAVSPGGIVDLKVPSTSKKGMSSGALALFIGAPIAIFALLKGKR